MRGQRPPNFFGSRKICFKHYSKSKNCAPLKCIVPYQILKPGYGPTVGHRGEIRGSVQPGIEVTMRFCFKLGLVLVSSDCGITADVDKSVNTSAAHDCAFCETKSLCKNAKCDAYKLFCGTNSHNQCCHCWGFFTRSGVFLFHLGFGGFY